MRGYLIRESRGSLSFADVDKMDKFELIETYTVFNWLNETETKNAKKRT